MYRIALLLACALLGSAPAPASASATLVPFAAMSTAGVAPDSPARPGIAKWRAGQREAAVASWQGPAAQGDAESQFQLAQALRDGEGTPMDAEKAEDLFRKAALQGHLEASDEYGILLFQSARVKDALPWVEASARRGEPRAQYYLGVAHFNGDDVEKNWVRAYALMTRAAASGLAPAISALNRMDAHIPLEERRRGVLMAEELENTARETRTRDLTSVDLAAPVATAPARASTATQTSPEFALPKIVRPATQAGRPAPVARADDRATAKPAARPQPRPAKEAALSPSALPTPSPVAAKPAPPGAPARQSPTGRPAPGPVATQQPGPKQIAPKHLAPKHLTQGKLAQSTPAGPARGSWRIQLGAFSVKANAEGLWSRLRTHRALGGRQRFLLNAGPVVRLQAGPFASEAEARQACASLAASHGQCMPLRP